MAKLESSLKNMLLSLTAIALIAAGLMASLYSVTSEPIQKSKEQKSVDAIKAVLPAFDKIENDTANGLNIFKAYKADGQFIGAAVESMSKNGFGGEIKVMVGFDAQGNITEYSVLEQKETPGLGTKMVTWFRPQTENKKSLLETIFHYEVKTAEKQSSIIGKNPAVNKMTVSKDGGEIDAITASTISSRAFLESVRTAYNAYAAANNQKQTDANSGATQTTEGNNNEQ
ncbi:MAG: RnfABCDGE type electron transport complex subunit G [Salinivirgaceae bacterium]|nr:RnfABCDGE type electron transport complex subunit G [Salinivirgaceae bacterium]